MISVNNELLKKDIFKIEKIKKNDIMTNNNKAVDYTNLNEKILTISNFDRELSSRKSSQSEIIHKFQTLQFNPEDNTNECNSSEITNDSKSEVSGEKKFNQIHVNIDDKQQLCNFQIPNFLNDRNDTPIIDNSIDINNLRNKEFYLIENFKSPNSAPKPSSANFDEDIYFSFG
jgi:hypothetical protein